MDGAFRREWIAKHGTTYTIFANEMALRAARTGAGSPYLAGSILAVVTWGQRDDPHWFGGRIPDLPLSTEFVEMRPGPAGEEAAPVYTFYSGSPFSKQTTAPHAERVAAILAERGPQMP